MSDQDWRKVRIQDLIPAADLERVDANPHLSRIKTDAIVWENAAQELLDDIQERANNARLKLKSAEEVHARKQEVVDQTSRGLGGLSGRRDALKKSFHELESEYEGWTGHYESVNQIYYANLCIARNEYAQAEEQYKWAEGRYWQLEEERRRDEEYVLTCRSEVAARERFRHLVSQAVQGDLYRRSTTASEKIKAVLDAHDRGVHEQ